MIKDVLYKIVILILLIVIIFQLGKITTMVIQHYEAFDENPLFFGAEKYGIDSCSCMASGKNLNFNQTSIWIIGEKSKLIYATNFSNYNFHAG